MLVHESAGVVANIAIEHWSKGLATGGVVGLTLARRTGEVRSGGRLAY